MVRFVNGASIWLAPQVSGDDGALDFAGSFVNGDDTRVAIHALYFGFAGIAERAMNLDGFVDDAIDHFTGVQLGAGGRRGVARGRKRRRTRGLALRHDVSC